MNVVPGCAVFMLDDGSILVEGCDFEPSGPGWLTSPARVRLSPEMFGDLLGITVLKVLAQTKVVRGADVDNKQVLAGRYLFSGTKSERAFVSKAKCLELWITDSRLQITPTSTESGGYRHLPDRKALCDLDAGQVHDLILSQLKACDS